MERRGNRMVHGMSMPVRVVSGDARMGMANDGDGDSVIDPRDGVR